MKTLKILAFLLAVLIFAASCSQNHYAKGKRKMKSEIGRDAGATCRR